MTDQTPAQQKAEERIPWDQATTDAVGLSCDAVHNTRDIARAAYATCYVEEVEPRDRIIQDLVDQMEVMRKSLSTYGPHPIIDSWTDALLSKIKSTYNISPKP